MALINVFSVVGTLAPRKRIGKIVAPKATPVPPMPLLATAPINPATAVPCPASAAFATLHTPAGSVADGVPAGNEIANQIGMIELHAGVDDCDSHTCAGNTLIPGGNHVDVLARHAEEILKSTVRIDDLPDVQQMPLIREIGIGRNRICFKLLRAALRSLISCRLRIPQLLKRIDQLLAFRRAVRDAVRLKSLPTPRVAKR